MPAMSKIWKLKLCKDMRNNQVVTILLLDCGTMA
jgi:hypothetical protein